MGFSYLLDEVDGGLEVQTKVDELPLDALSLIFFLLQDEHLNHKVNRETATDSHELCKGRVRSAIIRL
jgi:hypothetical protein